MVHGRKGLFNSVYAGATATGAAFPGAVNPISPEAGDTMARARSRAGSSCIDPITMTEHCGLQSITPSANVVYNEIWKPAPLPTDSFSYGYQHLTTASPTNVGCFPVVDADLPHHHSLRHHRHAPGSHPSAVVGGRVPPARRHRSTATGVLDLPGHLHELPQPREPSTRPRAVAGRLARTDRRSRRTKTRCNCARTGNCCSPRNELRSWSMGAVQSRARVPGPPDDNGIPTHDPGVRCRHRWRRAMRAARRFFSVMNNATHAGMLSPAELRLLSEWLDIGAQYYNDPFPPTPQN